MIDLLFRKLKIKLNLRLSKNRLNTVKIKYKMMPLYLNPEFPGIEVWTFDAIAGD